MIVVITAIICSATVARARQYSDEIYVPGEVIVKFKSESGVVMKANAKGRFATSGKKNLDTKLSELGIEVSEQLMPLTGTLPAAAQATKRKLPNGKVVERVDLSKLYCLKFDKEKEVYDIIHTLSEMDEVEYAEPNYIVQTCETSETDYSSDPLYSQQWALNAINLPQLWQMPVIESRRPVIAIIDTGVDITHPDLKDNIWTNELEATGAEFRDDDANGFYDDIHGWDFVKGSPIIETGNDFNGHGTHCAGIAAASGGNGIGIVGANPDAYIMPVRSFDDLGHGDIATIIKGIDYAVASHADVISMSFGHQWNPSISEEQAIINASFEAICCAAAGNSSHSIYDVTIEGPAVEFPAGYESVIGVMASDSSNSLCYFSNYDPDGPFFSRYSNYYSYDVMLPGIGILSTYPGGTYKMLSGTSMACPLLAGAVSRILQIGGYQKIKEYGFQGDLTMAKIDGTEVFDAPKVLEYNENTRGCVIRFAQLIVDDTEYGNGDGKLDAGEIVEIYPVLKSLWGPISEDLVISCELDANMVPGCCEFIENNVDFGWHINSRGSATSKNPIKIKIGNDVNQDYNLVLRFTAKSSSDDYDYNHIDVSYLVSNLTHVGGVIDEDVILTPDRLYLIDRQIDVIDGALFKVMPGTTLMLDEHELYHNAGIYASNGSKIEIIGTPDSLITFKGNDVYNIGFTIKTLDTSSSLSMEYVKLDSCRASSFEIGGNDIHRVKHIINNPPSQLLWGGLNAVPTINIIGICNNNINEKSNNIKNIYYSNLVSYPDKFTKKTQISDVYGASYSNIITTGIYCNLSKFTPKYPSYWGSNREDIIRSYIYDSYHPTDPRVGIGKYVLDNRFTRPLSCAHGIVWKILIDGIDAGDDFENLPPLGVGTHKLEVYFNREMDQSHNPRITMGLQEPYTQTTIESNGFWRSEPTQTQRFDNLATISSDNEMYRISSNISYLDLTYYNRVGADLECTGYMSDSGNIKDGLTISATFENLEASIKIPGEKESQFGLMCEKLVLRPNESLIIDNGLGNWTSADETIASISYSDPVKPQIKALKVGSTKIYNLRDTIQLEVEENPEPQIVLMFYNHGDLKVKSRIPSIVYYGDKVDVYTTYFTLNGKENIDGLNRLCITEARDTHGFEIPKENQRFNVMVQSSGSFSVGFFAETGSGKVMLNWEDDDLELDDMLGFNMYRYTTHKDPETGKSVCSDTIKINQQLITDKTYIDYDVTPGTTYYYYYRKMRTDFSEHAPSKVVAATPNAVGKGDANASGAVDVADVVTEVNYMVGRDPKPFVFDAADVNDDKDIDVLDVVGTVNIIMGPADFSDMACVQSTATYSIKDGILYVDSPVELAGVQAELGGTHGATNISVLPALKGMESSGDWISDEIYRFIAFSLSGKTLAAGSHALLSIGDAELDNLILVDAAGNRVVAFEEDITGISSVVKLQMKTPTPNPFIDRLDVPVLIGIDGEHSVELNLVDLAGVNVCSQSTTLAYGEHVVCLNAGSLQSGFYMLTLIVDGKTVQTHKVIKK